MWRIFYKSTHSASRTKDIHVKYIKKIEKSNRNLKKYSKLLLDDAFDIRNIYTIKFLIEKNIYKAYTGYKNDNVNDNYVTFVNRNSLCLGPNWDCGLLIANSGYENHPSIVSFIKDNFNLICGRQYNANFSLGEAIKMCDYLVKYQDLLVFS